MDANVETERKYHVRWPDAAVVPLAQELASEVLSIVHIYPPDEPDTRYGQLRRDDDDGFEYARLHKAPIRPGSRLESPSELAPETWAYMAGRALRGELPVVIKTRYCWEEFGLLWELDVFHHPSPPQVWPAGPRLMLLEVEQVDVGDFIRTPTMFEDIPKARQGLIEYSDCGLVDVTLDDQFYAVNLAAPIKFNHQAAGVLHA